MTATQASDPPFLPTRSPSRQLLAVLLTLLFLGGVLGGLFWLRIERLEAQGSAAELPLPVTARVLNPRPVQLSLQAIGTLRAQQQVVLAPEVAGRIEVLNIESGLPVEAGALLLALFDAPERADREAARADVAFTREQWARSQQLVDDGSVSRELYEQHRSDHERAEAALQQAEARLQQKQLRAPFAGITGIRRVDLGQYLTAGEAVVTLTALDSLYVDFSMPQQALSRLVVGAEVRLHSDAWPEREFEARVSAVEAQIDADTRNVLVQASLDNDERLLRPGMYVQVSLMLPPREHTLVVPLTAIQASASGESVMVVRGEASAREGIVESVPVVSGQRIGNEIIIEEGLRPGEVVITEGQVRLQEGSPVTVAEEN